MGWSCTLEASRTWDRLHRTAWTRHEVGTNVAEYQGDWYMWERSNRDHDDGRITGQVWRYNRHPQSKNPATITRAGNFRIDAEGKLTGPAILHHLNRAEEPCTT